MIDCRRRDSSFTALLDTSLLTKVRKGSIPTLCGYPGHFRLAAETGIPAAAAQRLSRARSGLNGPDHN